jgi:hypothetical protein
MPSSATNGSFAAICDAGLQFGTRLVGQSRLPANAQRHADSALRAGLPRTHCTLAHVTLIVIVVADSDARPVCVLRCVVPRCVMSNILSWRRLSMQREHPPVARMDSTSTSALAAAAHSGEERTANLVSVPAPLPALRPPPQPVVLRGAVPLGAASTPGVLLHPSIGVPTALGLARTAASVTRLPQAAAAQRGARTVFFGRLQCEHCRNVVCPLPEHLRREPCLCARMITSAMAPPPPRAMFPGAVKDDSFVSLDHLTTTQLQEMAWAAERTVDWNPVRGRAVSADDTKRAAQRSLEIFKGQVRDTLAGSDCVVVGASAASCGASRSWSVIAAVDWPSSGATTTRAQLKCLHTSAHGRTTTTALSMCSAHGLQRYVACAPSPFEAAADVTMPIA